MEKQLKKKLAKEARDKARAEALGLGIGASVANPMVWYTFFHTGDDAALATEQVEAEIEGVAAPEVASLSEEEKSAQFGAEVGELEFVEYRDPDWKACCKGIIEELKATATSEALKGKFAPEANVNEMVTYFPFMTELAAE